MESNNKQKEPEDDNVSEPQTNISHMSEELRPSVSDSEIKPELEEINPINSETFKEIDLLEPEEPMQIGSPSAEEMHAARQAQLAFSGTDEDDYDNIAKEDHYYSDPE